MLSLSLSLLHSCADVLKHVMKDRAHLVRLLSASGAIAALRKKSGHVAVGSSTVPTAVMNHRASFHAAVSVAASSTVATTSAKRRAMQAHAVAVLCDRRPCGRALVAKRRSSRLASDARHVLTPCQRVRFSAASHSRAPLMELAMCVLFSVITASALRARKLLKCPARVVCGAFACR